MPSVFKYNGTEIIDSSGKVTASSFPSNSIVQTQYTSNITQLVDNSIGAGSHVDLITSSSFTTTGSNKVLAIISLIFGECNNIGYGLQRDGTFVGGVGHSYALYMHPDWLHGSDNYMYSSTMDVYSTVEQGAVYLDSPPAGTHVYKVCAIAPNSTGTMNYNRADYSTSYGAGRSSLTLLEIKA